MDFDTYRSGGKLYQVLGPEYRVGQYEIDRIASMKPGSAAKLTGVEIHDIGDLIANMEEQIKQRYSPEMVRSLRQQAGAADIHEERYLQELINFMKSNPRKPANVALEADTSVKLQPEATVKASGYTIGDINKLEASDGFNMHEGTASSKSEVRHDVPILDKDGNETAHAIFTISEDGKTARIGWIGRRDMGGELGAEVEKPKLGLAAIRDLLSQLKQKIPTLQYAEGARMSGAHANDKPWQRLKMGLRPGEKLKIGEPAPPKPPREEPLIHFTHPDIEGEMTLPYDKFFPSEIINKIREHTGNRWPMQKAHEMSAEQLKDAFDSAQKNHIPGSDSYEHILAQDFANSTDPQAIRVAQIDYINKQEQYRLMQDDLKHQSLPENVTKLELKMLKQQAKTGPLPKVDPKRFVALDGKLLLNINDYQQGPKAFTRYVQNENGEKFEKPVYIHPDYLKRVNNLFDDHSWIRDNPILSPLLKLAAITKGSVLALSPFHWTTVGERGFQMGMNPQEVFKPESITPDRKAMTSNFPPLMGSHNYRVEAEGVAGFDINKIPYLKEIHNKLFGFDGYISRLKANAFDKVTNQIGRKFPEWTRDQVDFASSRIVDGAFGGLNWKSYGWSMNSVDALRLFMLAPDFTGSQIAFAKAGFEPGGSVVNHSLARIALYNFAVSRIVNLLYNGNLHMDHPFGLVNKDGDKVYNVRTMPADIMHALTDPRGFSYYRLSPPAKFGAEVATGKDEYGHRVNAQQEVHDLLRNVLPITLQNALPAFQKPGETILGGLGKSVGLAPELNKSQAGKTASNLASHYNSDGPVDQLKLEKHQRTLQQEDALRSGKMTWDDINKAIDDGQMAKADVQQIRENYKKTKGMDYETAYTYNRSSRLPMAQFLEVWHEANEAEKKALEPLLVKKRKSYFNKAYDTMTPEERKQDDTYMKLRKLFPEESPY